MEAITDSLDNLTIALQLDIDIAVRCSLMTQHQTRAAVRRTKIERVAAGRPGFFPNTRKTQTWHNSLFTLNFSGRLQPAVQYSTVVLTQCRPPAAAGLKGCAAVQRGTAGGDTRNPATTRPTGVTNRVTIVGG